jgi:hypothetical protein
MSGNSVVWKMSAAINPPGDLRDLSCKEAARLMSFRRDRVLTGGEHEELRLHLLECLNCQNFDRQLDVLAVLAKRFASGVVP